MTRMLMDASALFKRYNQELGRARVMQLSAQAQVLVVAAHCRTEIASALNRQRHDGVLNDTDYAHILDVVQRDFGAFDVVPIDRRVEGFAISAMQRARLRGMDALHIGSAQAAAVELFVTADRRQADAARNAGLLTELIEA